MSHIVTCPNCSRRFSPIYSRAVACGGCPSSSLGDCGMIKCPFCGHEWSTGGRAYVPRHLI